MQNNEDYLDSLLNNVTKKLSEFDEDFEQIKQKADPYMTKKNLPPKTRKALESVRENQFLREFENELDQEDADRFLEEFETELDGEAQAYTKNSANGVDSENSDPSDGDYMDQIDQLVSDSQAEPQLGDQDPFADLESADDVFHLDDSDQDPMDMPENLSDHDPVTGSEMVSGNDLSDLTDGMADIDSASAESSTIELPEGMEALGDLFGSSTGSADEEETLLPEDGEGEMSNEDILKMLGESSDDEALSDIGKMLEADEQSISLDDLGAEPESLAHAADAVENQQASEEKEPKKKKNGFFAKLMDLLFGEDEDDEVQAGAQQVAEADSLEGISDENMEILRAMNSDTLSEPEDKGSKKKKKKEKKKKEKEPKPKKEKKEKKKKEPKPKKEKKEKKPKEKGPREKPLPKGPVIMIWLMALSILALVLIGNQLLTKGNAVSAAEHSFDQGDYVGTYENLVGVKLDAKDQELYERASVLAGVQAELNAYYPMMEARKFDLALDCLVRALGRADLHMSEAEEWGVTSQMDAIVSETEQQLKDQFDVSAKQARKLYAIEDRDEYSLALDEILQKLGLK